MSHLHRGMHLKLEKLTAIEITEYLAFTECKLDIFYILLTFCWEMIPKMTNFHFFEDKYQCGLMKIWSNLKLFI